jgi:hypothetical protein
MGVIDPKLDNPHSWYTHDNPKLDTALQIFYVWASINVAASIVTLFLIAFMFRNGTIKMNLYIKCVILLTLYQSMYDSSIIPFAKICTSGSGNSECIANSVVGFVYGGTGAASFSLLLIIGALFTIEYQRKTTFYEELIIFGIIHVLLIAYSIPNWIAAYEDNNFVFYLTLYQYVRFGLIFLSFFAIIRIYLHLKRISLKKYRKEHPLYHLVRKLVYYPIVQSVTRLGTTPYDLLYHDFMARYPKDASLTQTILLYCQTFLSPAAGIMTFLVFLSVQKSAFGELKKMFQFDFTISTTTSTTYSNENIGISENGKKTVSTEQRKLIKKRSFNAIADANCNGNGYRADADGDGDGDGMSSKEQTGAADENERHDKENYSTYSRTDARVTLYETLNELDEDDLVNELLLSMSSTTSSRSSFKIPISLTTVNEKSIEMPSILE